MRRICYIMWTLIITNTRNTVGTCVFPSDMRGVWHSAEKGDLTISDSNIFSYPMFLSANVSSVNWWCNQTEGSKYILSGNETFEVFGDDRRPYLCIEFTQISQDLFIYYVGTKIENSNNDRIFVRVASESVTPSDVCNRPLPWEPGTFVTLVRKDVNVTTFSRTCPDVLLRKFQNVSITLADNSDGCNEATMDVCTDTTTVNVSHASCNPSLTFSDTGDYVCVYDLTEDGTTYVALWNLDNSIIDGKTYRTTCYAIKEIGSATYATEIPGICHYNQTPEHAPSPGVMLTLTEVSENCVPSTSSGEDNNNILVGNITGGIFGSVAAFFALLILVCIACKFKNRSKETKILVVQAKSKVSVSVEDLDRQDESPIFESVNDNIDSTSYAPSSRLTHSTVPLQNGRIPRFSSETSYRDSVSSLCTSATEGLSRKRDNQKQSLSDGKQKINLVDNGNRSTSYTRSASPNKVHFQTNQQFVTGEKQTDPNYIARSAPSQKRTLIKPNQANGRSIQTMIPSKEMTQKSPYASEYWKTLNSAYPKKSQSGSTPVKKATKMEKHQIQKKEKHQIPTDYCQMGELDQSSRNGYLHLNNGIHQGKEGYIETEDEIVDYHGMALSATDNYKLLVQSIKRKEPQLSTTTKGPQIEIGSPEPMEYNSQVHSNKVFSGNQTSPQSYPMKYVNQKHTKTSVSNFVESPDSGLHAERAQLTVHRVDVATSPILFNTDQNQSDFRPGSVSNKPNNLQFSKTGPNVFKPDPGYDRLCEYMYPGTIKSAFANSTFTSLSVVPAVISGYEMAKYNPPNIKRDNRRRKTTTGLTERDQMWCIQPGAIYKGPYTHKVHYGSSRIQHPSNAFGRFKVRAKAIIPWR